MVFDKIADVVVRHHKKILILWLVVLILAVPAITRVNEVLVYQESEMVEGDIESLNAQEIIDEQFPTSIANSTIMIVVTGPDVTSNASRDFSLGVEARSTAEDGLAYVEEFSSVYSVYRQVIMGTVFELGPVLYETEEEVNFTAFLLYGVPSGYAAKSVCTST